MKTIRINLAAFTGLCFTLFLSFPSGAQVFEKVIDSDLGLSSNNNIVTAAAIKSNGNRLVAFRNRTSTGEGAAALAEMNSNGDTLWVKQFQRSGTNNGEVFVSIIKELPNNQLLLVGGSYSSSIYYHGTFWITDNAGNILTYKRMDYNNFREITINDVDIDSDGSIYFAGNYYDFLSAGVSFYNWTVPLFGKFNPNLSLAWAKTYGSTNHTSNNNNEGDVKSIELTPDGNLMVFGLDGRHNQNNPGTIHQFKVDTAGQTIWNKQKPNTDFGRPDELVVTENGDYYTSTEIAISPQFGPTTYTTVIEKFDADGNAIWSKSYGDGEFDQMNRMGYDEVNDQLYLCGHGLQPGTDTDGLLAVIDSSGSMVFCKAFHNDNYDSFTDVVKSGNNYLVTGHVNSVSGWMVQTDQNGNTDCAANDVLLDTSVYPVDYTPGINTNNIDFTYIDFTPEYLNGTFSFSTSCYACADQVYTVAVDACGPYMFGDTLRTVSGTYFDEHTSVQGCDSIIALDLTIIDVDVTTTVVEPTISANAAVATYSWLDCDDNYAVIAGETSQSFMAMVNGNFAVEVSQDGCVDTSACVSIFSVRVLESALDMQVSVYPNPAKGNFNINLGQTYEEVTLTVQSIDGKQLETKQLIQTQQFNYSIDQASGIYLLRIVADGKTSVVRVVNE